MDKIKFIYFDVGFTLVDESKVWDVRCKEQAKTKEAIDHQLTAEKIYHEFVQASIEYKPQYTSVVKKYNFKEIAPYRFEYEVLYDDCIDILEKLSKNYRLGIIGNQSKGLSERLKQFGILQYFSVVISSSDYNIKKPDIKLFRIGVEKSNCNPSEIVMVGDRLDNDIYPANAVGMKTVRVQQGPCELQHAITESYEPTWTIHNLRELLDLW